MMEHLWCSLYRFWLGLVLPETEKLLTRGPINTEQTDSLTDKRCCTEDNMQD